MSLCLFKIALQEHSKKCEGPQVQQQDKENLKEKLPEKKEGGFFEAEKGIFTLPISPFRFLASCKRYGNSNTMKQPNPSCFKNQQAESSRCNPCFAYSA